jgi:molecular chaperone GrpE
MQAKSNNEMTDRDLADELAENVAASKEQNALEQLQARLQESEERALRLQAETENIRKRLRREMDDERKYAPLPLMRDLLPALDNFHRALVTIPEGTDTQLIDGIKMVAKQVLDTFQRYQCQVIDEIHVPFDPTIHEAVGQVASTSVPTGFVVEVRQSGYRLHDRVIRPAFVVVSSGTE